MRIKCEGITRLLVDYREELDEVEVDIAAVPAGQPVPTQLKRDRMRLTNAIKEAGHNRNIPPPMNLSEEEKTAHNNKSVVSRLLDCVC